MVKFDGFSTPFDGVMFDLDGTLIESVPDLADSVDQALADFGYSKPGEAKVRTWVGNGASLLIKRALAWAIQCDVERLEIALVEANSPELYDQVFTRFYDVYEQRCCLRSQVYSGVIEFLDHLKAHKIPMAVVTNKPMIFTQLMLRAYDLEKYFLCVIGGDSLAEKKPSALPLQTAMEHLGTDHTNTLMIGDSVTDIKAARAANCQVLALPYGYNHGVDIRTSGADQVVERLDHLIR